MAGWVRLPIVTVYREILIQMIEIVSKSVIDFIILPELTFDITFLQAHLNFKRHMVF